MRIFADGGCSGNPGPGAWAYIISQDAASGPQGTSGELSVDKTGSIIEEKCGFAENTTNNRMELLAVISALEALALMQPKQETIEVYTDSQYVQKGMSEWIRDWKARGWKTAAKDPVKNQDLWQRLDNLASGFSVGWHWVKGHAGNVYNERCDALVQEAIKSLTG